jgi:hypothetical protein
MGFVVKATPLPFYSRPRYPVRIVQEAWWNPGPAWTAEENLSYTWIRSPDRPTRSQLLYRIRFAIHICKQDKYVIEPRRKSVSIFIVS